MRYKLNGVEVTREQALAQSVGIDPDHPAQVHKEWVDHFSEAAAVHPDDRVVAMQHARDSGVPTHFDTLGRPQFHSLHHQRRYLKVINMHNRDDIAGGGSRTQRPEDFEYAPDC